MTNAFSRSVVVLLLAAAVDHGQGGARPSFEVASVKAWQRPTDDFALKKAVFTAVTNRGIQVDPVRARFAGTVFKDLISFAYRVEAWQISAPEWMSGTRYEIVAKIPAGVPTNLVPEMLQSLLEDRFQLKCHRDKKEFAVFILSVWEGGLKIPQKPADYRFSATSAALPRNMEFLANELMRGVGRPVIDRTGLNGDYMVPRDFTTLVMKASLAPYFSDSAVPERAVETPTSSDLRLSLQAMGLSLNPSRQDLPLLVVDHAEKTPAEN